MPLADGSAGDATRARASHVTAARELQRFSMGAERIDIRGWPVFGSDGALLGTVARLLVETSTGNIRYASVSLAGDPTLGRRHGDAGSVLVPIGLVHPMHDRHQIVLDFLTGPMIANAPRLAARPVTRADEDAALAAYGFATSRDVGDSLLYSSPHFDERRLHRRAEP